MKNQPISRMAMYAPLVCFVLLVGMIVVRSRPHYPPEKIEAYDARIKRAVERIPYKIGDWVGTDQEVTEAAQKLLKPNVLLERRYQNLSTGRTLSILFVHCGYIRDMAGHYPPVCYPASGWQPTGSRPAKVVFNEHWRDVREYTFERSLDGRRSGLKITDFFVLPSKQTPIIHDLAELRRIGERKIDDGLGVAQIQIVTYDTLPEDERKEAVQEFMQALAPVISLIGDGIQ